MTNSNQTRPDEVAIIGAGLAGLMMALYLAQRDYVVMIYEKSSHPDSRFQSSSKATDLNLSQRACLALKEVGLLKQVMDVAVATYGRIVYFDRETSLSLPHSHRKEDVIYNVNRPALFKILLHAAQNNPHITLHFSHEFISADTSKRLYRFKTGNEYIDKPAHIMLGCDGANSRLRDVLNKTAADNAAHVYLYKQFFIPNTCEATFPRDWMYQWNDENFILVGHTDIHQQFNCTTVCIPEYAEKIYESKNSILTDDGEPFNKLKSTKVARQFTDGVLLLGDAAHGMLPFLAQGVNSAFEDCRLLNYYLKINQDNWDAAIKKFGNARQVDTNAIIDMSAVEYSALMPGYDKHRQLFYDELLTKLHQRYPADFFPYRYLLAFTHLPYAEIFQIHTRQLELLKIAYQCFGTIERVDWHVMDDVQLNCELGRCG